jgi:DNA-binding NtrC family response regulator
MSITHVNSEGRFRLLPPESQKRFSRDNSNSADSILLGESVAVRRLRSQVQRIAPYFRMALIRGEIGSGKQMVGRALHARSPGADGPFVVASACRLDEPAFGDSARPGTVLLELARGGTLFLGGVGELSFGLQEVLFRFLRACDEHRAVVPPAVARRFDDRDVCVANLRGAGMRILASSDRDLGKLSAIGQFRQDLYARLSAVEIFVPPLRQRVEDIPILASWLLRRLADGSGHAPKLLAEATVARLQERAWPSNLHELERVIAQAAALADGGLIEPRHLLALAEPGPSSPIATTAVKMERLHDVMMQHVLDMLTRCGGNKVRAAERLGISRSTLYRMLDARVVADGCS